MTEQAGGGTRASAPGGETLLEARGVSKNYGGVTALDRISLEIRGGEILALIGDNGAGKSTLTKVLCGAISHDDGEILHRGEPVSFSSPMDARSRGIETVYQDLALAPVLDVAANLFLGREIRKGAGFGPFKLLDNKAMAREAEDRLKELAISLPQVRGVPVRSLSGGQQQAVAVARAAAWATDVIFMDEPTAALGVRQSTAVLDLARRLAQRGTAVVLITHTLPQVMEYADRVVVLRHGKKVADLRVGDVTAEMLVSLITGLEAGES
ncbi:MAG TPA: ATP-binding cassette domain-containing protein [Actinomycetota bacterium]|nr:ATP-binding cassette domain-containing protein [Actinomycetota bacterium]